MNMTLQVQSSHEGARMFLVYLGTCLISGHSQRSRLWVQGYLQSSVKTPTSIHQECLLSVFPSEAWTEEQIRLRHLQKHVKR